VVAAPVTLYPRRLTVRFRPELFAAFVLGLSAVGCGHTERPPAAPAGGADNVPGAGAVRLDLYPRDDERWTLRRADDTYVCTLPCSYWARPESALVVRLEGTAPPAALPGLTDNDSSFALPEKLPAAEGERLTLTVDRTHGLGALGKIIAAPSAVIFGLTGLAFTTLSTVSLATGSKNTTTTASACASASGATGQGGAVSGCTTSTTHGVASDVGGLAFGVGALAVSALCIYWFIHDREGGLRYEDTPTKVSCARLRLDAAALGLAVEARGTRATLGPGGVTGSF
jgi:hypothetical protein